MIKNKMTKEMWEDWNKIDRLALKLKMEIVKFGAKYEDISYLLDMKLGELKKIKPKGFKKPRDKDDRIWQKIKVRT